MGKSFWQIKLENGKNLRFEKRKFEPFLAKIVIVEDFIWNDVMTTIKLMEQIIYLLMFSLILTAEAQQSMKWNEAKLTGRNVKWIAFSFLINSSKYKPQSVSSIFISGVNLHHQKEFNSPSPHQNKAFFHLQLLNNINFLV